MLQRKEIIIEKYIFALQLMNILKDFEEKCCNVWLKRDTNYYEVFKKFIGLNFGKFDEYWFSYIAVGSSGNDGRKIRENCC